VRRHPTIGVSTASPTLSTRHFSLSIKVGPKV
jgi:hypothetical protein